MSGNGWPKQVSHKHHNKHTTHPTVTKSSMQSHKRATPQPSPTHQSHTHTPSGDKQEDRGGTRPACHNKVKHQQPWSFAITHTVQPSSQPVQKALGVGVCGKAHATHSHAPQGRGEPWLMTRGVHHGSSHSHTQVANTPATVQHALVHAMVSINHATHTHTHTKGRGPWIDGQSGIHNMPPLRE